MTEWQDISTVPMDGSIIQVYAPGYEWPEVVFFERYDEADAEEIGEVGYWRYAETLLAEATDDAGAEDWTHWMPLPVPPGNESFDDGPGS